MTESITAALRRERWLGKFCRADDLDLVNGAKNRGSRYARTVLAGQFATRINPLPIRQGSLNYGERDDSGGFGKRNTGAVRIANSGRPSVKINFDVMEVEK
jgi:hypothetical protein